MGLDTLQSRTDRAKLKWWYKLATYQDFRHSLLEILLISCLLTPTLSNINVREDPINNRQQHRDVLLLSIL